MEWGNSMSSYNAKFIHYSDVKIINMWRIWLWKEPKTQLHGLIHSKNKWINEEEAKNTRIKQNNRIHTFKTTMVLCCKSQRWDRQSSIR